MMTEEQKQALINDLQSEKLVLEKWRDDWNARDKVNYQAIDIALAALTQTTNPDMSELTELIKGMKVSVDVSTTDDDAGNRYFGTVTEVVEHETGKNGFILLVQDPEPNFTEPAIPALKLPDGWRLMPNEPTEEMMRAMYQAQDMWPSAHCDNMRETQMSFARPRYIAAIATAPKAPSVPHTASIEPICSTGGVKVPQGWSLVPNEATRVMIEEGDQWELSENIWNAMIGVAPKP